MDEAFDQEVKKVNYPSDDDIERSVSKILREILQASDHLVIKELTTTPLNKRSCSLKLDIDKTTLLSSTKWWGIKPIDNDNVRSATQLTEGYLNKISEYLSSVKKDSKSFSSSHIYEMLNDLFSTADELSAPEKKKQVCFCTRI